VNSFSCLPGMVKLSGPRREIPQRFQRNFKIRLKSLNSIMSVRKLLLRETSWSVSRFQGHLGTVLAFVTLFR
jgi:hypothetical protein